MKYDLEQIIDVDKAQRLLESFCDAVGVAAAIIDVQGKVIVCSRWQRICTEFHRQHEVTEAGCIASDTHLANALAQGERSHIYRCKNGLTDAAAPILIEGEHVANALVGQFLLEPPNLESFRLQAGRCGFDTDSYLEALAEVPVIGEQKIPALLEFLGTFAEMVAAMGIERQRLLEAQHALQQSEQLHRTLAESSPVGIWQDTERGEATYANPAMCRMLQVESSEELAGADWRSFFTNESLDVIAREHEMRLQGRASSYEVELVGRRGRKLSVVVYGAPLFSEDGRFQGTIATFLDITDRKRAEEERLHLEAQIQHAQKLESLGVLAGGIAHDFNNLLMAVLGNADLALQDLSAASPVRANLDYILTAARRAADLCRQLLAYSGRGKFVPEPLDLSQIVDEMVHMLEVSVAKSAVLRYDLAKDLPAVEADGTQIRQVVMNLITNASDAVGERSGVIVVRTGVMQCDHAYLNESYLDDDLPEGLYSCVEVNDTGCGMDTETQAKLFDPFFTTKFTGRGLGLSAVLGIVRGHRGAIKVYSEPGKGTTFKVLFPAIDQPARPLEPESEPAPGWCGNGAVLLVDDEKSVREVGIKMLEKLGFSVVTAIDGKDALRVYKQQAGDIVCVLLDLTMPHMNGEETFRELRRLRPDLPVILSSGYNEHDVTQRFAGKGLAGFIQKPYHLAALQEEFQRILG